MISINILVATSEPFIEVKIIDKRQSIIFPFLTNKFCGIDERIMPETQTPRYLSSTVARSRRWWVGRIHTIIITLEIETFHVTHSCDSFISYTVWGRKLTALFANEAPTLVYNITPYVYKISMFNLQRNEITFFVSKQTKNKSRGKIKLW